MVDIEFKSQLQLRSHAIRARNQHRILEADGIQLEKAAKTAYLTQNLLIKGSLGKVFNPLFGAVAAANIHSGVGVSYGRFGLLILRFRGLRSWRFQFWQGVSVVQVGYRPSNDLAKGCQKCAGRRWDL